MRAHFYCVFGIPIPYSYCYFNRRPFQNLRNDVFIQILITNEYEYTVFHIHIAYTH